MTSVMQPDGDGSWWVPVNEKGEIDDAGPRLPASTRDLVVVALHDYRASNGLEIGEPGAEFDQWYCRKWPRNCGGGSTVEFHPLTNSDEPAYVYGERINKKPVERVSMRTAQWYSSGPFPLVEQEEADKRAAICLGCEHNQPWVTQAVENCHPCLEHANQVKVTLVKLRQNKSAQGEERLGACMIAGHPNEAAVWMPESRLEYRKRYTQELEQKKPECWLLSLT